MYYIQLFIKKTKEENALLIALWWKESQVNEQRDISGYLLYNPKTHKILLSFCVNV